VTARRPGWSAAPQICGHEKGILRSADVAYAKYILQGVLVLFDYCLLRDGFGMASVSERRAVEARPKKSRSSSDLNNTKTLRIIDQSIFVFSKSS